MRKLFLNLICFSTIAFSACTDELSQDHMSNVVPPQNINVQEKDASSQQAANNVYNALMNSFVNTSATTRGTQIEYAYPENYGGAYINKQGKLVIKIKGEEPQMSGYMRNISISDDNVTYEKCNYSMNELYKVYNSIIEYKRTNTNSISDNYSYVSISQTNNKVVVELKDCSDAAINKFKKAISDSPAILFKASKGDILLVSSTDVNPGSQIVGSYGKGSVGYRAKDKDGNEGIVTCAHVIGNNADLKVGSTVIGKCTNWSFGGHVDAAFCKITKSTYKPTNIINTTTNELSTSVSWPAETTVINKCGAKTGLTSGTIEDATATCWSKHPETGNTIEITDATKAKIDAYKGDSGGIVYTYVSSTGIRYTVGIMNAIEVVAGTEIPTGYAYYIKAPYINSVFNLTRY